MKKNKLFNILVTGGALLTVGTASADNNSETKEELKPVFCTSAEVCQEVKVQSCSSEEEIITKLVPKEGFACCWATSCADFEEKD